MRYSQGIRRVVVVSILLAGGCPDDGGDDGASSGETQATSAATGSSSGPGSSGAVSMSSAPAESGTTNAESGTTTAAGCDPPTNDNPEYLCCDGAWIDPRSDQLNCGGCGSVCEGDAPFCDQGSCAVLPCESPSCMDAQICCGAQCCDPGTICCTLNGPIEAGPGCVPPTETGSCPGGCAPLCQCAAPETAVATPTGDRPIAELRPGDLVYSIDHDATVAVPIVSVQRVRVHEHHVAEVELDDGRRLRVTPSHPLADGRSFGDLRVGQPLGDGLVVSAGVVTYDEDHTHDILPRSSTGIYFVAGEPVASTMAGR
jgi:hypothetical protein